MGFKKQTISYLENYSILASKKGVLFLDHGPVKEPHKKIWECRKIQVQ